MTRDLLRPLAPITLLQRLINAPDFVRQVRSLPQQDFAALVRQVGVEDAGELIAFATTKQLVAAFDEDLFLNQRPGEREAFQAERFITWLEVLLEAGDEAAAKRMTELSPEFVINALSSIMLVLDHDALVARMSAGDSLSRRADSALENALNEEIDGYLLASRYAEGWDALMALILALDRGHREFLEYILDRCASLSSEYVEDLDELIEALSSEESLAEDVEAEREDRRSKLGYVEPRAARAFLALARGPLSGAPNLETRDPLTTAYFRERERDLHPGRPRTSTSMAGGAFTAPLALPANHTISDRPIDPAQPFIEAMQQLREKEPRQFEARMEELAYLANVLVAGATLDKRRIRPQEAAEAVLATVAWGAHLRAASHSGELYTVLLSSGADFLFRQASGAIAESKSPSAKVGFLRSRDELARELLSLKATAS